MALFECCRKCVAPKRHPGCHTECVDYLRDKAKVEKRNQTIKEFKRVEYRGYKYYKIYGQH